MWLPLKHMIRQRIIFGQLFKTFHYLSQVSVLPSLRLARNKHICHISHKVDALWTFVHTANATVCQNLRPTLVPEIGRLEFAVVADDGRISFSLSICACQSRCYVSTENNMS
jgi:hypothetical protein